MGISVVIPVFNSELSLGELITRLEPVLLKITDAFEVILINDGSQDQSGSVIDRLGEQHPWIHGIHLMRNYGQHNALLCGIRHAKHEIIVTMDDDLQHPPNMIPRLLRELERGHDVVYGTPEREQHGLWRDLASRITKLALQNAMGARIASKVSAFRAFRTHVRDSFVEYQGPNVSIDVLLTWGTTRFTSVVVEHEIRRHGTSNYTLGKLFMHATNMMTGFSTFPLRLASVIGFSFTLFGMGILGYVFYRYITLGRVVPGFAFLASLVALLSGAQLFALGIIGEYLARMHFRMMDRPPYTIRQARGER